MHIVFIGFLVFKKDVKLIKAASSAQIAVKMAVLKKKTKPKPKVQEKEKVVFKKPIKKKAKRKLVEKKPKKPKKPEKKKPKQEIKPQKAVDEKVLIKKSKGEINYMSRLREAIEKNKKYPRISRRLKEEGVCVLRFKVFKTGKFVDIVVLNSSGKARLDKAALKAVVQTAQFEPFTSDMKENFIELELPMRFKLN